MLADHIGVPQLRDLASRSEQVSSPVRVNDMPRLAELLHPDVKLADEELDVRIRFLGGTQGNAQGNSQSNIQGFPEIRGHLTGSLHIYCQRCLGPLDWSVDIDFHLVIINSMADFDVVAEPFDAVVAGEHGIRLAELIEDELLSSLPFAPMHADLESCETSIGVKFIEDGNKPSESGSDMDSDTNRPFGDLAALLKAGESSDNSEKN